MQLVHDPVECPKCHKIGFVKRSDDIYQCIYCHYRHQLSASDWSDDFIPSTIAAVLAFLFMLVLLGQTTSKQLQRPQSSNWLNPPNSYGEKQPIR